MYKFYSVSWLDTQLRRLALLLVVTVATALSSSVMFAQAQTVVAGTHPNIPPELPSWLVCKICGPATAREPAIAPRDFDPLTASAAALQFYGFPPRPDPQRLPEVFVIWKSTVSAMRNRIVPKLQPLTMHFGAPDGLQLSAPPTSPMKGIWSDHWSGFAIVDSNNPFAQPNTAVYTTFVVPDVILPPGNCSQNAPPSVSFWVGIDGLNGFGSSDILQTGILAFMDCSTKQPIYTAWYEWWPADSQSVGLQVSPGDSIQMTIVADSSTEGTMAIVNLTTNNSVFMNFNAPKGTTLVGNTIEWVVERPGVGTPPKPVKLADYHRVAWGASVGATPSSMYWPGPEGNTTGDIYNITMRQNSTQISTAWGTPFPAFYGVNPQGVTTLNNNGMWFFSGYAQ